MLPLKKACMLMQASFWGTVLLDVPLFIDELPRLPVIFKAESEPCDDSFFIL